MIAALLDHLWQSTLFASGVGLLTLTVRRNEAPTRYWLWFVASVKFLIPISLFVTLGNHLIPQSAMVSVVVPTVTYTAAKIAAPFSGATAVLASPSSWVANTEVVLLGIWGLGSIAVLQYWWARWARIGAALRLAKMLPIAAPIPIKSSQSLIEPGLVGIRHPVLLIPEGLTTTLSPDEIRSIVSHELCHLRRRDNLTAAIHMLVEGLFWFHPFTWWLGARMIEERERACDESVVASGNNARVYAESILKVCRFYLQSPLTCAAGVSGADFRKRVEVILNDELTLGISCAQKLLMVICTALAIALPTLLGLLTSPITHAQTSTVVALEQRIKNNIPSPGTEKAIRRYIVSLESGQPNYDGMSPAIAEAAREEMPTLLEGIKTLGALKAITFEGVGADGWDIYVSAFGHGKYQWRIAPLSADCKVLGLSHYEIP
jgi:bla regulator protein blaR1